MDCSVTAPPFLLSLISLFLSGRRAGSQMTIYTTQLTWSNTCYISLAQLLAWCFRFPIPATGLCICLCSIHDVPNHPLSCLPSPLPTAPSGCSCELAEIPLHSLFLVLAKVLNSIGSSLSGLLAGFYSAGQNPPTSQLSTRFTFQLSS